MVLLLFFMLAQEPKTSLLDESVLHQSGFFDLYWAESSGTLLLGIPRFNQPFLWQGLLSTGVGSNDIGLDRGDLGSSQMVFFRRVGPKVFLIKPNILFRAVSDNPAEQKAVEESFASATLWSAPILDERDGKVFVDIGSLVFQDHHNVVQTLQEQGEGSYQLDKDRSYYELSHTKSFPFNTEIEVALTFTGQAKGDQLPQVASNPNSPSLRCRNSFIQLPDQPYTPRDYHPKAGGFFHSWRDYAAPLDADLNVRCMPGHRLELDEKGNVIRPIVYYVDNGAPKEIQDALLEGASWWAAAFEAAGFKNAFQVKLLPPDADPLDIRYNVIQWVHRLTRGWSYGAFVLDPRSGEILKGHVTLGSLRVRQDRLLFEGMIPRDASGGYPAGLDPVQMSLARIRQLSAHELGHTIGLVHNFYASTAGRASVMDYPAPLIRLKDGQLDFSDVYARGIGEWDKIAVRCLYEPFADPKTEMGRLIAEGEAKGLFFIGDEHSRGDRSFHPGSHLWDNGTNAVAEAERVFALRNHLLAQLSTRNLRKDVPLAQMHELLVPVYLHHRYQLQALATHVGGARFDYGFNDGQSHFEVLSAKDQRRALELLLSTLDASFLDLPAHLRELIPPRPPELTTETRELFQSRTGDAFDDLAMAETSAEMTLSLLLSAERLNRLYGQSLNNTDRLSVETLFDNVLDRYKQQPEGRAGAIHRMVNYLTLNHLLALVGNPELRDDVRSQLFHRLNSLAEYVDTQSKIEQKEQKDWAAHFQWLKHRLKSEASWFVPAKSLKIPPGAPI